MVTAKIVCSSKNVTGEGDDRQASVAFHANYADDANKEWAKYTPALSLNISVNGPAVDMFEVGGTYTLTFEADRPADAAPASDTTAEPESATAE